MYLVGPQLNPSDESAFNIRLDLIALVFERSEWVAVPFTLEKGKKLVQGLELPDPHLNRKSRAWDPGRCGQMSDQPCVQVSPSAFLHAVLHDDGEASSLWTTVHCREVPSRDGTAGPYNMVRWYEIALNDWPNSTTKDPEFRQWGEINKGGQKPPWECYDPSIAVNSRGDMALT